MSFDLVKARDAYFRNLPWPLASMFEGHFNDALKIENLNRLESRVLADTNWYTKEFESISNFLFDVLKTIDNDDANRLPVDMVYSEYFWDTELETPGWNTHSQTLSIKKPRSFVTSARYVSRISLEKLLSMFVLFHKDTHQALYPEFTQVSAYLLAQAPSRRAATLLRRTDLNPYFDDTDDILEDPSILPSTEYPTSPAMIGQINESNIQTWTNAIKKFVELNDAVVNRMFVFPTLIERTDIGYDPTVMVNVWKKTIQGLILLLGLVQEIEMNIVRVHNATN